MNTQTFAELQFARRTSLRPNEYRKNYHQLDEDVATVISSDEADKVTPLMSKIYIRLVNAPRQYWEQKGVLRFTAEEKEGQLTKATTILCEYLGVSRATATKALKWMHEVGVIGYFAGKNGVGVRIFLNRACNSIGIKPAAPQNFLPVSHGSFNAHRGSQNEPAFNDSFAVKDISDKVNPLAPKNGAEPEPPAQTNLPAPEARSHAYPVDELITRLKTELEPCVTSAAARVAAQAAAREFAGTREWFEYKALPKSVRIAQKESYDVLRKYGLINKTPAVASTVGKSSASLGVASPAASSGENFRERTALEITELAECCAALFELQGKPVEETLRGLSRAPGKSFIESDILRISQLAHHLIDEGRRHKGN